uniref:Uncharacterized protein n=1 Tax=Gossypium raimondii TaxID=29730 RepID=A0A0D2SLW5_GOSRA|nr:hypothetical protein B456_N013900 [Gossypium raimondii]
MMKGASPVAVAVAVAAETRKIIKKALMSGFPISVAMSLPELVTFMFFSSIRNEKMNLNRRHQGSFITLSCPENENQNVCGPALFYLQGQSRKLF